MKKIILTICILSTLSLFAFKSIKKVVYSEFKKQIIATLKNWNERVYECEIDYDKAGTYLTEGLRIRYACLKNDFGLLALKQFTGEDVFASGPHKNEMELFAQEDFGHYNPAFLTKLNVVLSELLEDKDFISEMKHVYDEDLKKTFQIYFHSYKMLNNEPEKTQTVVTRYQELIAEAAPCESGFLCPPSDYLQESYREYAEAKESEGYDVYEAFTAPGFWVRRKIDGTDKLFFNMLKTLLLKLDPEFTKL